jgi:tol-pal system protein YbgF
VDLSWGAGMLPQNRPTVKICGEKLALGEAGPYALGPVVRMRVYAFLPPAAALVLAGVAAGGCASTSEERQLADMRAEIDKITESRDRADQEMLAPEAAESQMASVSAPAPVPAPAPIPADQDAVILGRRAGDANDDYADTEDTAPRPVIRVFGSQRAMTRGGWRGDDPVDSTGPDDGSPRPAGSLDPAASRAYDAALSLVNAKQYDRALDALAAFLVRWPDHPYADNAMYWRGECYFARGEYLRASEQFEGVIARFPVGNKVPDALLKLGISHLRLGDPTKAKECFDRLAQTYGQSEAARHIPSVTVPSATPRGPASEDHR